MTAKVTFLCVLTCLSWILASAGARRNCSDCVKFSACAAAGAATEKLSACAEKLPTCVVDLSSQMVEQLASAACGFDGAGVAMICCSELTAGVETASIDNHPNLALLPDNCGAREEGFGYRISGGVPVLGLYDYPWMVFISYHTQVGPKFLCGGSLINDRYVLTAAHCLSSKSVLTVRIREYEDETIDTFADIPVEEAISHPGYRRKPVITDDIGILRLKNPVYLYSNNAGTICLPVTHDLRNLDMVGQGATVAHRKPAELIKYESATLLYVDVTIHSTHYCQEQYNKTRKHGEEDKMINKTCSNSNGMGSCRGVSGGPLMVWGPFGDSYRFIQYGVVSYGPNGCGSNLPEVYTDVTKYMTWILNSLRP